MTAGEGPALALAGLAEALGLADLVAVLAAALGADLAEVAAFADGEDMGQTYLVWQSEQKSRACARRFRRNRN
jgi:hypothetical protein